jgi:hypothetical protein
MTFGRTRAAVAADPSEREQEVTTLQPVDSVEDIDPMLDQSAPG